MYDETGRLMRDNFWRPDLGGVDWDGVLDRYRPVLDRVATHDDLVDLLWEVQGELGTSHAYVTPRGGHGGRRTAAGAARRRHLPRTRTALGASTASCPSETSDPDARSPLAAPGRRRARRGRDRRRRRAAGRPGDRARAAARRYGGQAGRADRLAVRRRRSAARGRRARSPTRSRCATTRGSRTGGRTSTRSPAAGSGYLHVPDMQAPGWAQIHRDLRIEVAREGLVVDVRENRGGHTSQLVVEKLARRIVGWDLPRGMRPYSYPRRRAPGAGRRRRQRVLRVGRGHRQRGDQGAGDRAGGGYADVGRRRSASTAGTGWSTGRWSPSRSTPSGWRGTGGAWRTTASTRTWRSCSGPAGLRGRAGSAAGRGGSDGAGGRWSRRRRRSPPALP